ncbi:hypothetical protein CDD81_854 [Ophiocordyceps australis]|uniref:AA1-like domain-containing protein n=1 Tax=Ophiocordyceps australis TaxID=1399860 RepID=A0A2C5Y1D1_9HYPO|nr:hypothetical protein CDD81_854 [Ophiocordyceps australis]
MFKTLALSLAALSLVLPAMGEPVSADKGYSFKMHCTNPLWLGAAKEWPVTMKTGPLGDVYFESEGGWFSDYSNQEYYMCNLQSTTEFHFKCGELARPLRIKLRCTKPSLGNTFFTTREDLVMQLPPGGDAYLENEKGKRIAWHTLRQRYCYIGSQFGGARLEVGQKAPACIEQEAK